jgi:hypothetical protein
MSTQNDLAYCVLAANAMKPVNLQYSMLVWKKSLTREVFCTFCTFNDMKPIVHWFAPTIANILDILIIIIS